MKPPRAQYTASNPMLQQLFDSVDLDVEPPMPSFTEETAYAPETDFERWLTAMIWQRPAEGLARRSAYLETLPDFQRPDNRDILPPGAVDPEPPRHWVTTPVHFGSWPDGRYTRLNWCSHGKYTFNDVARCRELYAGLTAGDPPPRRVLDAGTGMGASATALAQLFPAAVVVGIDLAPHLVRFARGLATRNAVCNIDFYRQHAGATAFETGSFDLVVEAYVLHEQPQAEARLIIDEMDRLLRPGGRFIFADVIVEDDPALNEARVHRGKGPEPFLAEYMKLDLGNTLASHFGVPVERSYEPGWDCMVWTGVKAG